MANVVNGFDLDTQSGRADFREAGGWVEGSSSGGYDYQSASGDAGHGGGTQTPTEGATFNTGGGTTSTGTRTGTTSQQGAEQYGSAIERLLQAIADGNKQAFDRAVHEFDVTFAFDKEKFTEDIRRFNQNYLIAEAGLTGTYGGNPTLAAQQQAYQQQFNLAQLAAQAQANPFRQAQIFGQANRILQGQGVAGFQAPNVVAGVGTAGGNQQGGLGYLQQIIDDIRNPVPNQTTADAFLAQTPTPNKIDSVSFVRAAPTAQNLILQAMQEKYGIDPNDALAQIQNTLPQFTAPTTTVGVIKR